jgi:hypothetical protein
MVFMFLGIIAIVLSVFALTSSTALALNQIALMRRANYLAPNIELNREFRSLKFQDNYKFVTETLPAAFESQLGISGLPDEARAAIYEVGGLFQILAQFVLLGTIDIIMLQFRMVHAWRALAPFVERERELNKSVGIYFWRTFEEIAEEAAQMPDDAISNLLKQYRKRSQRHQRWRRLTKRSIVESRTEPPSVA